MNHLLHDSEDALSSLSAAARILMKGALRAAQSTHENPLLDLRSNTRQSGLSGSASAPDLLVSGCVQSVQSALVTSSHLLINNDERKGE